MSERNEGQVLQSDTPTIRHALSALSLSKCGRSSLP